MYIYIYIHTTIYIYIYIFARNKRGQLPSDKSCGDVDDGSKNGSTRIPATRRDTTSASS